jgi:hypothetical protein
MIIRSWLLLSFPCKLIFMGEFYSKFVAFGICRVANTLSMSLDTTRQIWNRMCCGLVVAPRLIKISYYLYEYIIKSLNINR